MATAPTPWSMAHDAAGFGGWPNVQLQVICAAEPAVTEDGEAEKVAIAGATGGGAWTAATVVVAESVPAVLEQVRVKTVSAESVTDMVSPLDSAPTPRSTEQVGVGLGTPVKVQVQVTSVEAPAVTDDGEAETVAITGATGGGTAVPAVTVVVAESVPAVLEQVSVKTVPAESVTDLVSPLDSAPTPWSMEQV
ncbi:MAG TPA: hypothetical protein VLU43_07195, partial [Anaeromyxobacteraceae bacterium]|nr:hypothetical protein [Anaeromyxobacteraceae bacterium]